MSKICEFMWGMLRMKYFLEKNPWDLSEEQQQLQRSIFQKMLNTLLEFQAEIFEQDTHLRKYSKIWQKFIITPTEESFLLWNPCLFKIKKLTYGVEVGEYFSHHNFAPGDSNSRKLNFSPYMQSDTSPLSLD